MRGRYLPLASLVAGTTFGGILLGGIAAGIWAALAPFESVRRGVALGLVGFSLIALAWPRVGRFLPERACQVRRGRLARGSHERAAFLWGAELGLGFCTFLVTPAMYALPAVLIVQVNALLAATLCAFYGLARGATIATFAILERRWETRGGYALQFEIGHLERALRVPLAVLVALATWLVLA